MDVQLAVVDKITKAVQFGPVQRDFDDEVAQTGQVVSDGFAFR